MSHMETSGLLVTGQKPFIRRDNGQSPDCATRRTKRNRLESHYIISAHKCGRFTGFDAQVFYGALSVLSIIRTMIGVFIWMKTTRSIERSSEFQRRHFCFGLKQLAERLRMLEAQIIGDFTYGQTSRR